MRLLFLQKNCGFFAPYVFGKDCHTNQKNLERWGEMDIYIKPVEKAQIIQKRDVLLRDIAEVFIGGQTAGEAEKLVVFRIPETGKKTYLLSVVDIIKRQRQQDIIGPGRKLRAAGRKPHAGQRRTGRALAVVRLHHGKGLFCFAGFVCGGFYHYHVLPFGYTGAVGL